MLGELGERVIEPVGEPSETKGKSKIKIAAVFFAGVVAVTSGIVAIVNYFQSQNQHHVASFSGELTSLDSAAGFAAFLRAHDQKIVQLDIECGETDVHFDINAGQVSPDSRCFFLPGDNSGPAPQDQTEQGVLTTGQYTAYQYWRTPANTAGLNNGVTWFEVDIPASGSDSTISNGPKGAGWVIVKGYFSESRTSLGTAPPETDQYILRAVNISDANK